MGGVTMWNAYYKKKLKCLKRKPIVEGYYSVVCYVLLMSLIKTVRIFFLLRLAYN